MQPGRSTSMRRVILALLAPAAILAAVSATASAAVPAPDTALTKSGAIATEAASRRVTRTTVRGPRGVHRSRTVVRGRRGVRGGAVVVRRGGGGTVVAGRRTVVRGR